LALDCHGRAVVSVQDLDAAVAFGEFSALTDLWM